MSLRHDIPSDLERVYRKLGRGICRMSGTGVKARNSRVCLMLYSRGGRLMIDSSIPLYLPPTHQVPQRSPIETSLSTLLASGAALGHSTSLLNPFYTPYVYGNRSGISIIDLDQTLPILRRTASMIREVVKADGVILVVGTRRAHERILEKAKTRLGDNGFVVNDWLPGTLTNSETLYVLFKLDEERC